MNSDYLPKNLEEQREPPGNSGGWWTKHVLPGTVYRSTKEGAKLVSALPGGNYLEAETIVATKL